AGGLRMTPTTSDQQQREVIAAAANTVTGVNVNEWFRQTTKSGDGYVVWSRGDRASNGIGFMNRWEVFIVLPSDLQAAEKWLDERLNQLVNALHTEVVVTSFYPTDLALDSGKLSCVVIEGSRARD